MERFLNVKEEVGVQSREIIAMNIKLDESDMLQMTQGSDFHHPVFRYAIIQAVTYLRTSSQFSSLSPIHTGHRSFKGSGQHSCTYSHMHTPTNTILTQGCCKVNDYLFPVRFSCRHCLGLQQRDTRSIKLLNFCTL